MTENISLNIQKQFVFKSKCDEQILVQQKWDYTGAWTFWGFCINKCNVDIMKNKCASK